MPIFIGSNNVGLEEKYLIAISIACNLFIFTIFIISCIYLYFKKEEEMNSRGKIVEASFEKKFEKNFQDFGIITILFTGFCVINGMGLLVWLTVYIAKLM